MAEVYYDFSVPSSLAENLRPILGQLTRTKVSLTYRQGVLVRCLGEAEANLIWLATTKEDDRDGRRKSNDRLLACCLDVAEGTLPVLSARAVFVILTMLAEKAPGPFKERMMKAQLLPGEPGVLTPLRGVVTVVEPHDGITPPQLEDDASLQNPEVVGLAKATSMAVGRLRKENMATLQQQTAGQMKTEKRVEKVIAATSAAFTEVQTEQQKAAESLKEVKEVGAAAARALNDVGEWQDHAGLVVDEVCSRQVKTEEEVASIMEEVGRQGEEQRKRLLVQQGMLERQQQELLQQQKDRAAFERSQAERQRAVDKMLASQDGHQEARRNQHLQQQALLEQQQLHQERLVAEQKEQFKKAGEQQAILDSMLNQQRQLEQQVHQQTLANQQQAESFAAAPQAEDLVGLQKRCDMLQQQLSLQQQQQVQQQQHLQQQLQLQQQTQQFQHQFQQREQAPEGLAEAIGRFANSTGSLVEHVAGKKEKNVRFPKALIPGVKVRRVGNKGMVVDLEGEKVTLVLVGKADAMFELTPEQFEDEGWTVGHWNPEKMGPERPVTQVAVLPGEWAAYGEQGQMQRDFLQQAIVQRYSVGTSSVGKEMVSRLAETAMATIAGGTGATLKELHRLLEYQSIRAGHGWLGGERYLQQLGEEELDQSTAKARKAGMQVKPVRKTTTGPAMVPRTGWRPYTGPAKNGPAGKGH